MRAISIALAMTLVATFSPKCHAAQTPPELQCRAPFQISCLLGKAPVVPPIGLFTNVKMPIAANFRETPTHCREQKASVFFIGEPLYLHLTISWGKVGVAKIARDAGFHKVHYADAQLTSIFPFLGKATVTVCGE